MSNHYSTFDNDPSGRHPVNVGHLVMGIAFLGLVAVWVLVETEVVQGDDLSWFLPLPWLAAGLAGLLAVSLTSRRGRTEHPSPYAPAEPGPSWTEPEPSWTEPEPSWTEPDDVDGRDDRA